MIEPKITNSPTFCPAPWTTLRLGTNGEIGICPYSKSIGNYLKSNINDILKNNTIKSIKDSMLHGQWHTHCEYCKHAESHGGRSERLLYLKNLSVEHTIFINDHPDENVLLNCSINWNNLCNLSCTYCNPNCSTEWQKVKNIPLKISNLDEDSAVKFLINNQKNLQSLTIGGGEPLLQKSIHKLLNQIAKPLEIHVTTNLSVPLDQNPMYHSVMNNKNLTAHWMISFDCLHEKFEYVRHNASWDVFYKNIQILKEAKQHIIAHPAYCLYSAFDIVEFYEFCVDQELDIFWCDLFSPYQLDVRFAPMTLRNKAIGKLDTVIEKYKFTNNLSVDTLIEYKKMVAGGIPLTDSVFLKQSSDHIRANHILKFIDATDQELKKELKFKNLWLEIYSYLQEYYNE